MVIIIQDVQPRTSGTSFLSQGSLKSGTNNFKGKSATPPKPRWYETLPFYWVGQKVHLGFSITSYGKKAIKLFGQPYWMLRKSTVLTPRGVWLAWASTRGRRGNTPGQGRNWVLFEASIEVSVPVYCSSARLLQRVSRLDSPCWQAGSARWGLADGDHVAGLRFPPLRDMCSQHPSATASGARHQQEGPTIALLTRSLTLY